MEANASDELSRKRLAEWFGGTQTPILFGRENALGNQVPLLGTDTREKAIIQPTGTSEAALLCTLHIAVRSIIWLPQEEQEERGALVAGISWGQGGAQFYAEADVHDGTAITLAASSIQVGIRWRDVAPTPLPWPVVRPQSCQLAGAVVWGTKPARARATRTVPGLVPAAPGVAVTFPVPLWAESVQFFAPTPAAFFTAGRLVTLHAGPLVTDDPVSAAAGTTLPNVLVPIPEPARFVTVGVDGLNASRFFAMFNLSI